MKRSVAALSTLAFLVAGCSSQGGDEADAGSTSRTASRPPAHLGETLNLTRMDGSKIAVTVIQLINPATLTQDTGEANKIYVAAKLKLAAVGAAAIEGDVNVNVSLVGSNDQDYTPDLHEASGCTNFEGGAFHLDPREAATGCVVFALPRGVNPVKVKYEPSAGFADDFGEWLVS